MSSEFLVLPVSPAAFDMRWDQVKPMLDSALPVALGRFEAVDVLQMMAQAPNVTQGWFILRGAELLAVAITQIQQFPRRRCCTAFLLAGKNMKAWFEDWYNTVEAYAIRTGCDHMEAFGRPGWQKVLDLEPRATVLVKDLPKKEQTTNEASMK